MIGGSNLSSTDRSVHSALADRLRAGHMNADQTTHQRDNLSSNMNSTGGVAWSELWVSDLRTLSQTSAATCYSQVKS